MQRLWKRTLYGISMQRILSVCCTNALRKITLKWGVPKRKANCSKEENKNIFIHDHPVSYEGSLKCFPTRENKCPNSSLWARFPGGAKGLTRSRLHFLLIHLPVPRAEEAGLQGLRWSLHTGLRHCRFLHLGQREVRTVCRILLSYF